MVKLFATVSVLLSVVSLSLEQFPTISDESGVDDYLKKSTSIIVNKLSVESLPEYAQDDGSDIINELRDDLAECKENLLRSHSMWEFKACVHQQMEDAEDRIWDFKNSLEFSSKSYSLTFSLLLIPLILIPGLF